MEESKREDKNEGKKEFSISLAKGWVMKAVRESAGSWDNMRDKEKKRGEERGGKEKEEKSKEKSFSLNLEK